MDEIVTIENTEMQIREYNGRRVVTFKDVDIVHQRPRGTASRNFKHNKKRFIENEDYFVVTRNNSMDEIRPLKNNIPPKGLTVLTESGYLMLTKSFDDDLSWQVQRSLVNGYFKAKSNAYSAIPDRRQRYNTSSTPVPKNPSWYDRNKRRIRFVCENAGKQYSKLYHVILTRVGEEYDLDEANRIYEQELGYKPKYAIDLFSYFPELGRMADDILDKIEEYEMSRCGD